MVARSGPLDLPAVVALMYRADWSTLSLAATVTVWTRPDAEQPGREASYGLLVAPGRKYRISSSVEDGRVLEVGDGEWMWVIVPGWPGEPGEPAEPGRLGKPGEPRETHAARWAAAGPGPPFEDLLLPARLLSRYSLELTGTGASAGRPGYQIACWPRLAGATQPPEGPDLVGALVDPELGILLRYEEERGGQPARRIQVTDIRLHPAEATEPGRFQPPPGLPVTEGEVAFRGPGVSLPGLPGDAVRAAAGITATAMGFVVRHWPSPDRPAGDGAASPTMPDGEPTDAGQLDAADDDLINLLHRTGRPVQAFTAEVREWQDRGFLTRVLARGRESLPPAIDGIFGPDAVWDAIASRAETTQKVMRLRLAAPARYRIDTLAGGSPSDPETTACDGERRWLVRGTKVTYCDAMPLPRELARLADPAWLLARFTVRAGGEIEVGSRRGRLVVADRRTDQADRGWRASAGVAVDRTRAGRLATRAPDELRGRGIGWLDDSATRVEAVVDEDLAVVLRLVSFAGGRPVMCYELRGLVPGIPDPHVFEVPQGARRTGPLEGAGLLSPANAVKGAAGLGVAGTAALVGWLQKRPRTPEPPPS